MVRFLIGIILAILVIIIGFFVYFEGQKNINNNLQKAQTKPTSAPTPQKPSPVVPLGFVLYKSPNYSLYRHPKMLVRNEGEGIVAFVLVGPSQKGQTELYDGINFTVQTGNYTQNTFKEFIDDEIKKLESDGTAKITRGVLSVSIGKKDGYEFWTRSLGEFRQIYFDLSNKKYVHVTILLEDPTNAGFEKIVEQMLQSLEY